MAKDGTQNYLIWIRPKNNDCIGFDYYFDKKHENDPKPVILDCILKTDNGFVLQNTPKTYDKISKYYPIRLVIHSASDFLKGQVSTPEDIFNQVFLKDDKDINIVIEDDDPQKSETIEGIKVPLIHLTLTDLYIESLFGTESLPHPVPRSYMIMDNSIWNYLVPLADSYYIHDLTKYKTLNEKQKREERKKTMRKSDKSFYYAVKSICNNYLKNLYRLKVTQEYADLNSRLAEQSYLSGAHASGVSPFIFHSETTAKQLVQREFRLLENAIEYPFDKRNEYEQGSAMDRICKHKWRILLLDDKAIEPMDTKPSISEMDKSKGGWNCKLTIIRNFLENQLSLNNKIAYGPCCYGREIVIEPEIAEKPNNNTKILIEYAQSIDEAEDALSRKKYDLVLIDYLLNQTDGTHYGYELLDKIWNDQQQHKNDEEHLKYNTIKPHHHLRMYCMFISAYSSAVHDRLLAEGLNQSEKYWFINLGACPTNTPQLFLYNLLKLMDKRLDDSHIRRLSIDGIIEVLENIFKDNVRKNAGELHQKIQSLQYYYRNLLQDYDISVGKDNIFETTKSVLVTHFLNDHINMGGLLEHLAQLVHLTAFGTIRQWPEMWEEYLYVKAQLEAQTSEDDKERLVNLCSKIEGLIPKLKSSAL